MRLYVLTKERGRACYRFSDSILTARSFKGQRPSSEPLLGMHLQIHSVTSSVHAHCGQVHCA